MIPFLHFTFTQQFEILVTALHSEKGDCITVVSTEMLVQQVESCLPVANVLLRICKFSVVTVCLKNVLFIIEFLLASAKLSSCMDQLHSILGETLHEPTAVAAVLQSNFDLERALDQILSQGNKHIDKTK